MERLRTPYMPEYTFVPNDQQFIRQLMGKTPKTSLDEYLHLKAEKVRLRRCLIAIGP